jgi:hypothetical protein
MKRLFLVALSACVLLLCITGLDADVIKVNANRTTYDSTWDRVVLRIVQLEDAGSGFVINGMLGTWAADGGISLTGTSTQWAIRTLNDADGQDSDELYAKQSWVNFANKSPDTAARTGTSPYFTSFYEGFNCTVEVMNSFGLGPVDLTPGEGDLSPGYNFDNTLLAVFFIRHTTSNWDVGDTIWTGTANFVPNHPGGDGHPYDVAASVQIVPEPSTLALLGCGLLGLLVHALRKRK